MLSMPAILAGDGRFLVIVDHAAPGDARQVGERHIVLDVLVEDQPEALAILRDIGDAAGDRLLDRTDVDLAPLHEYFAGHVAPVGAAEHAHRQFRTPRAHQAGDAEHLAAIDVKIDALDDLAPGMERVLDAPVPHLEQLFADVGFARRDNDRTFRAPPCS